MITYRVHEHFHSIQGEGAHAGQTAFFLRLQGCPVGCEWCDAKLTWGYGGTEMTLAAIDTAIRQRPATWVVITGGEPLIYDLDPLIERISNFIAASAPGFYQTQVETSGAYPWKGRLRTDWQTVSPKHRRHYDVDKTVMPNELKYVVDEHLYPQAVIDGYATAVVRGARPTVYLMPEGCPPRPEMSRKALGMLKEHPQWRFSPRLQYDYPMIGEMEGDTNQQMTNEEAHRRARQNRTG